MSISKIFERLIKYQLDSINDIKNTTPDNQFGFKYRHFTTYALNKLLSDVNTSLHKLCRNYYAKLQNIDNQLINKLVCTDVNDNINRCNSGYPTPQMFTYYDKIGIFQDENNLPIENVKRVHKIVLKNRKTKLREIADTLKISEGSVFSILHENLSMRKLLSKWVPRLLTPDQKRQRVDDSERCLELFKRNKKDFLCRYVTMDETWIHYYTPESKRSSAEWTAVGESRPKRPKTQISAGKVMASVFWDAHGILFIDYLEKGKTINSEYYMALLARLSVEIKKKRPHMQKKSAVPPR
ncbi:hypothetical protein KPH14_005207 [Odynerus spinipes]|uniref:Transposase n=1 Tax=Odynerus spinipes TaxID=1348599 RepID=A0AAD9RLZ6_9HYME|nr:hypothetical protein KPH14_005207 [Odynerus spinipes]